METRVLIVDDDLPLLKALNRTLSLNYELLDASNAQDALRLFEQHQFPIVVTDLRMKGTNGIELLRQIKALSPRTYAIMLTGNQDQEALQLVEASGLVDRLLHKPCNMNDLVEAINSASSGVESRPVHHENDLVF